MVRETSIEVYNQIIEEGLLSDKRRRVYEIIYQSKEPLTGAQISKRYKQAYATASHSETIRNRITELVEQGVVSEMKVIPCPITGRNVLSFQTNNNLPVPIVAKLSKKKKIENVLEKVKSLGKRLPEAYKQELRIIYHDIEKI